MSQLLENIVCNTRFRGRPLTGVERYAEEILQRLNLPPGNLIAPHQETGSLSGTLWDQVVLPRRLCDKFLWSPCSVGPLSVRRQLLTLHDVSFIDEPENFSYAFRAWYGQLIPRLARRATHLTTSSHFSADRICSSLGIPASKVTIIPPGVSSIFKPGATGEKKPQVLAVGAGDPRKNVSRLINAWTRLPAHLLSHWELVIVGSRQAGQFSTSDHEVHQSVHFVGRVSDTELARLYASASFLAYIPSYEGFGLPILEAMASGLACLVSDITVLRENFTEAALFVDHSNVDAIAERLRLLMEEANLRAELEARGKAHVRGFSYDDSAAMMRDLLLELSSA